MPTNDQIDNFFAMQSARSDRWRDALTSARKWASGQASRADFENSLAELTTVEEFHAYPGVRLMDQLREKIASWRRCGRRSDGLEVLGCDSHRRLFASSRGRRSR